MVNLSVRDSQQNQTLTEATDWNVIETVFDPTQLHHKETVFTISNGYLGTRGTFEEGYPGDSTATLINGLYDKVVISHTELVNCPSWLPLEVHVAGDRFSMDSGEILNYERRLDLRLGILSRDVRWRSPKGHTLDFHFERFTSLADQHVLAIRAQVTSIDFTGEISFSVGLDSEPQTQGVPHWKVLNQGGVEQIIWLYNQTRHSEIQLGMATKLVVEGENAPPVCLENANTAPTLTTTFQATPGKAATVEKIVTVFTSRETDIPIAAALQRLADEPRYATLLAAHIAAWEQVWQDSDIIIEGDRYAQLVVRYNLFQILAVAPRHDDRVSIPPKTLSGFAYRGHIFWDTEIFILPFLTLTQPALARNLLTYRYHTLPGARRKAQEAGFQGAMYAWESADTGDEVTPRWVPHASGNGELVRIWCGDIEVHINTDVAYAVWHYWQTTSDDDWMHDYGAEIILDTAVFWESRVNWNAERQSYDILDVIGPDENHDRVDNNAFTNLMVRWHLQSALALWDWMKQAYPEKSAQLAQQLNLTTERLHKWADIQERIFVNQDQSTGLIEQFEGFYQLEEINFADYEPRTTSLQGLLGIEATSQKQILKQPDVLMLIYLLREQYDYKTLATNWDYYTKRTDHTYGSSLGPAIHAILACDLNQPTHAYTHFLRSALVDLEDVRRNAAEGIHAASAGGVWQAVVFGFAGIKMTEFGPVASPHLPPTWQRLKFRLQWRNQWYDFDLRQETDMEIANQPADENLPSSQPEIQGVIFDLDGVLTDTSELHYLGWKRVADEEGIPFDREANDAIRGLPRRETLMQILGDRPVTEAKIQEMMERKNNYFLQLIEEITAADLLPGVENLLKELRAAGIKVALGSSSKNAQTVIQRLGIGNKFDAIADGYSVSQPKPAPDLFLFAAEQIGVAPAKCLVVEDASAGIEAARSAGMWSVGLGPVERLGIANVVLPSLEKISWQDLQQQLANNQKSAVLQEA
ncbi:glycoside hydrolase family 65, central catalytic [Tolypothrix tenuis PCC 7101]|uniref:Glycoside hydrolase family 65, central catalytic n=1 Tax=Tolypothrix tenuis PCC 7101 TaxID=231146 RepID=A0A1Z4N1Z9_9CYAN|nr:beta-phosphoglucomutase [Aulosira sp. FACHB-113]BAY99651.1 glycoside hydrolase family 65, central catalytic [Tolypothrix tenuis PCC 7101]BAZ76427.1 glycoside hydrolase family 65, central catalytic [Aulosira laxa NIES-50]